ncbi:MAG TPA: DUF1343 domain-containing protein [Desulfomonilaceae bacterium]|nr:DUF1343 domain-containing protein [Desulfomonilaceae bacterium]
MTSTGLERILKEPGILANSGRLGLLYNQASTDSRFRSAPGLIARTFPRRLTTLFGPQHGTSGTEQDNMKETHHGIHAELGLPVYSLYSETRIPTAEMLDPVDTVIVDIQDVGTRVYTFATTVLYLMKQCARWDKGVVILDRPNPINAEDVEGNLLQVRYASFVGPYPLPMRHGLTMGELMGLYNREYEIGCNLEVVRTTGWDRNSYFEDTGLPWILPSPNMPLVETAVAYPGQVLLEGTNISEGRGTTRPFEIFGAPFFRCDEILRNFEKEALNGVVLQEISFRPTFNKWEGSLCHGFFLHVVDRKRFRPYRFSLALLSALLRLYPSKFRWADPPYEYVEDKLPIDVITGDAHIREQLEQGRSVLDMEKEWSRDLNAYLDKRSRYLLYPS